MGFQKRHPPWAAESSPAWFHSLTADELAVLEQRGCGEVTHGRLCPMRRCQTPRDPSLPSWPSQGGPSWESTVHLFHFDRSISSLCLHPSQGFQWEKRAGQPLQNDVTQQGQSCWANTAALGGGFSLWFRCSWSPMLIPAWYFSPQQDEIPVPWDTPASPQLWGEVTSLEH